MWAIGQSLSLKTRSSTLAKVRFYWRLFCLFLSAEITIGDCLGWFGFATDNLVDNHVTSIGYADNFDNGTKMHQVRFFLRHSLVLIARFSLSSSDFEEAIL